MEGRRYAYLSYENHNDSKRDGEGSFVLRMRSSRTRAAYQNSGVLYKTQVDKCVNGKTQVDRCVNGKNISKHILAGSRREVGCGFARCCSPAWRFRQTCRMC